MEVGTDRGEFYDRDPEVAFTEELDWRLKLTALFGGV